MSANTTLDSDLLNAEKLFAQAFDMQCNKRFVEAVALYKTIVQQFPDSKQALTANQQIKNLREYDPSPAKQSTSNRSLSTSYSDTDKSSGNNSTSGIILIVICIALGLFTYAHRPPDGFVDAMNRGDTWVFKSGVYYIIMFIVALIGLAGIMRLAKGKKAPNIAKILSGGEVSSLDEIKKAKELLDAGAIDTAEFEKIKKKAMER